MKKLDCDPGAARRAQETRAQGRVHWQAKFHLLYHHNLRNTQARTLLSEPHAYFVFVGAVPQTDHSRFFGNHKKVSVTYNAHLCSLLCLHNAHASALNVWLYTY